MAQRGQVLALKTLGPHGQRLWAYRYRLGGRDSRRVQQGGFASRAAAQEALTAALARRPPSMTLAELVELYLKQHEAAPRTLRKLGYLLAKATLAFGDRRLEELRSVEIAAWRMTIPEGHRFETTQALRPPT